MNGSNNFNLMYDAFTNTILTDADLGVSINLDGFNGFDSKMIIVSMEFDGVIGESEVILYNLDGQPLSNQSNDLIAPKILFAGEYKNRYSINTEFQLFKAFSSDVLSPNITFTLTVKDPTGKIVTSKDGVTLKDVNPDEYIILLNQYGKYSLAYKATDGSGKPRQYLINLNVCDEIKPELTLSNEADINVSVGATVEMPTATATDNLDEELSIYVYLEDPNGKNTPLQGTFDNNTSFKATLKGVYKIKYLVTDNSGNFTMKIVTVNVK